MQKKWVIKNSNGEYFSDEGFVTNIDLARVFTKSSQAEENIKEAEEEFGDDAIEEFVVPVFVRYKTVTQTARATIEIKEPLLSHFPKIYYAMEIDNDVYLIKKGNRFDVVEPLSNCSFWGEKIFKHFNKWYRSCGFPEERRNIVTKWMKEMLK